MSSKRTQSKKLIHSALREQEEERNLDRAEQDKLDKELEKYDSLYRLDLDAFESAFEGAFEVAFEVDPEDYLDEPQSDLDGEEYYCDDNYYYPWP